uniref:Pxd_2 protein n=1 Tax=Fopius arisanus TaxID=64838 RepID=A0A0C9R1B3_9HYME
MAIQCLKAVFTNFQPVKKSNLAGALMAAAIAIVAVLWILLQALGILGHPQAIHDERISLYFQQHGFDDAKPHGALLRAPQEAETLTLPPINERAINHSVNYGIRQCDQLARLEKNLIDSQIGLTDDTPTHSQYLYASPNEEAVNLQLQAEVVTKASMYLVQQYCQRFGVSDEACAHFVSKSKLNGTTVGDACAAKQRVSCRSNYPYRTIDGSCNNPDNPRWGSALTAYSRILFPSYADGIQQPRGASQRPHVLPGARLVSTRLSRSNDQSDVFKTLAVMQWSQFIANDMAHTVVRKMVTMKEPISCCSSDGRSPAPRYLHPHCAHISVPEEDPVYGQHAIRCMNYVRSMPVLKTDCSFGPMEQMNQVTHFLDGSTVYGSDNDRAEELRTFQGGKLRVENLNGFSYLPRAQNSADVCEDPDNCYRAGDDRVNFEPHLAVMHTIWLREHNRIAEELSKINPTWSDEKLYQESRRIVIAEIQHITYKEWLPTILGSKYARTLGFVSSNDQDRVNYNSYEDPAVSNEASTAVLRFLNSLKRGQLSMTDDERRNNGSLKLSEYFYKPKIIESDGVFDGLLRGLTSQTSGKMDINFAPVMTQGLYRTSNNELGLDIISLDIQRGRDHGIPGYNHYRKYCGLLSAKTFDDMLDHIPRETVRKLAELYNHPNDVDLIVGGMAEMPVENSILGPTFKCLLSEQLARTRWTDRYFYDSAAQPRPFVNEQLTQIRRVTLARIICDNSNRISRMQPNAFLRINEGNELASCTDFEAIPSVDLLAFAEKDKAYR